MDAILRTLWHSAVEHCMWFMQYTFANNLRQGNIRSSQQGVGKNIATACTVCLINYVFSNTHKVDLSRQIILIQIPKQFRRKLQNAKIDPALRDEFASTFSSSKLVRSKMRNPKKEFGYKIGISNVICVVPFVHVFSQPFSVFTTWGFAAFGKAVADEGGKGVFAHKARPVQRAREEAVDESHLPELPERHVSPYD